MNGSTDRPNAGRIAGIILAAGRSSRMGRPKQLLPFKGKPVLAHCIETGLSAGLSPLILVLGHCADAVCNAVGHLPVRTVVNEAYASGMASSLAAGLKRLNQETASNAPPLGALFLLGDQPMVRADTIRAIMAAARNRPEEIIIPVFRGRRGNPVYFSARFFDRLQTLSGDRGGRLLFKKFPVHELPIEDPGVCLDLDTPADYERLCERTGPLIPAFGLEFPGIVSVVGGGGKTSLIFTLAREAARAGNSVLVTTTTAIFHPARFRAPYRVAVGPADDLSPFPGKILVAGSDHDPQTDKIKGYTPDALSPLLDSGRFDLVLVEADGARMRPVKAPAGHEPVIPGQSDMVAGCIGLDCLDQPLADPFVHRPEILACLSGQRPGGPVTEETLGRLIASDQGLFKSAGSHMKKILVLNKADNEKLAARACRLGQKAVEAGHAARCLVTALNNAGRPLRAGFG